MPGLNCELCIDKEVPSFLTSAGTFSQPLLSQGVVYVTNLSSTMIHSQFPPPQTKLRSMWNIYLTYRYVNIHYLQSHYANWTPLCPGELEVQFLERSTCWGGQFMLCMECIYQLHSMYYICYCTLHSTHYVPPACQRYIFWKQGEYFFGNWFSERYRTFFGISVAKVCFLPKICAVLPEGSSSWKGPPSEGPIQHSLTVPTCS